MAVVFALARSGWLRGFDRLMQDTLVSMQGREVDHSDVIIVGIDDKSVAALGQWPWRRSLHAAVVDRIDKDAPRSIGLNVLFTEADARFPADDTALAAALARSGKVVLPVMMQSKDGAPSATQPIPVLSLAAARLGHAHLEVDDDGIARSVFLREGTADRMWEQFSLAMQASGDGERTPDMPASMLRDSQPGEPASAWQRLHKMTVPFAGPPGHFRRVSYVDVLDGSIPAGTFAGKYVLVGATAAGLSDFYATPVSGSSRSMPGVEFFANVLDSLQGGHSIAVAPAWLNIAFNILPVLLALVGLAFVGPLSALLVIAAMMVALPAGAAAGMVFFGLQFAPTAGMLGLGVTYALWSWRKLDAATRYLVDELIHLRSKDRVAAPPGTTAAGDFMGRRIDALTQATQRLTSRHGFVTDSMEGLPDATLVCDRAGTVLLANAAAARHFRIASGEQLHGMAATSLMADVLSQTDHRPVVTETMFASDAVAKAVAANDSQERDLLVKTSPSFSGSGEHTGWILSLVDVTEVREAQRHRDHAMRFLSHDIRAPLASILTLLALDRQNPFALSQQQFHERIERHAKKALGLSDDFTQLVRAQSHNYRFDRYNLVDVLLECVDDAWEATRHHQIRIEMAPPSQEAYSLIDRELVARAIGNLLGNALKFSPAGSSITCAIESLPHGWAVLVQDQGPGIAEDLRPQLFQPFSRGSNSANIEGAGLGLAFVKTVAQRHGGKVLLESAPLQGSAFRLILPRA